MNILFLTLSDQHQNRLNKYCDLYRTGDFNSHRVGLQVIYNDVYIFDYYECFVSNGPLGMENRIKSLVIKRNIQLLIVPNIFYEIGPTFLCELRGIGCRSMIIFYDDSLRFDDTNRFYLNAFDYYLTHESVTSKALYKPFGIMPEFFPNFSSRLFYNEVIKKIDEKSFKYARDVIFIGAKIADRDSFVDYLKNNGIDIAAFGRGWESGMLSTEEMIWAYNSSRISLNFVKAIDGTVGSQLKGRLFEIVMAGGFVLSEYCDELSDYFDIGSEIDTFRTQQELFDKVRFYLENNDLRKEMSLRAKDKAEKNYSFESNWSRYLKRIENGSIKSEYPNPGYVVPVAAIKAFLNWNLSFIYGRIMLGQYGLAYQQYVFCRREIKGFTSRTSVAILVLKWITRRLLIVVRNQNTE